MDLLTGRAPSAPSMFHGGLYIPRERDLVSWNKNTAPLGGGVRSFHRGPSGLAGPLVQAAAYCQLVHLLSGLLHVFQLALNVRDQVALLLDHLVL